eukprot:TRINITY_DN955_c1_g1_i1.p1 TRINITY_DN955_c1_g1~~TRINITY_DN955_c1_g1_i1.p1  ORF type:complete len:970 (+),score=268.81 TRINITY_DN955_c1_g1_i1:82-2910(+)
MGNALPNGVPLLDSVTDARLRGLQRALEPKRACLPQVDPFPDERAEELRRLNRLYELDLHKGDAVLGALPPLVRPLPPHERFSSEQRRESAPFGDLVEQCVRDYMGREGERLLHSKEGDRKWRSFAELEETVHAPGADRRGFPRPSTAGRWLEDAEFGRQRLTGAHPTVLQQVLKCELLPKKLLVTDEQVIGLIEEDSVEDAVAARKLFIVDYHRLLDNIPTRKGTHLAAPIGLFYSDAVGILRPIAIQLYGGPTPQDLNPVFTPNDNVYAWRMAKMYFNQADMHYHLVASLLTRCMLAAALFAAITFRTLSIHHPVRQLMRPHLEGVLAEVDRAFRTLMGKSSPLPKVLACGYDGQFRIAEKSWVKYDFNNASFKHDYTERVDPGSPLLHYYYRDDAMQLWKIMDSYVDTVIKKYYTRPDDIDSDNELQKWTRECVNNLHRFMDLQPSRKEQPIVFNVASMLFHVTANFSALTFNIYQQYGFQPNSPGVLVRAPIFEKTKDQITEQDLLELLPDKRTTVLQTATAFVLSGLYRHPQAPHRDTARHPGPPYRTTYADNVSTGFSLDPPTARWCGTHPPPSPASAPNGEPPAMREHPPAGPAVPAGLAKPKMSAEAAAVAAAAPPPRGTGRLRGSGLATLRVHGIAGDHRQYCLLEGSGQGPSDAGDPVQEEFMVHTRPGPGLSEWVILKAPGKIGNWVCPQGEAPRSGPAAAAAAAPRHATFWARRLDVREAMAAPTANTIFVRFRGGSALLPASTAVGRSTYVDGYWEILYAFESAAVPGPASPRKPGDPSETASATPGAPPPTAPITAPEELTAEWQYCDDTSKSAHSGRVDEDGASTEHGSPAASPAAAPAAANGAGAGRAAHADPEPRAGAGADSAPLREGINAACDAIFADPSAAPLAADFARALARASERIAERNSHLVMPYGALDPRLLRARVAL